MAGIEYCIRRYGVSDVLHILWMLATYVGLVLGIVAVVWRDTAACC
jgi:hypothetical protein